MGAPTACPLARCIGVTSRGQFSGGRPTARSSKLNVYYTYPADSAAGKKRGGGGGRAGSAKAGRGAEEPEPVMVATVGEPLECLLTVAAQQAAALTTEEAEEAAAAAAAGAGANKRGKGGKEAGGGGGGGAGAGGGKGGKAVVEAEAPPPVMTELPPAGSKWETVTMELGRLVSLTLHTGKPEPLPAGKAFSALLVTTAQLQQQHQQQAEGEADGSSENGGSGDVVVRLLLFPTVQLPPALPLGRCAGQPIYAVQAVMDGGCTEFAGLQFGCAEDADKMAVPAGQGCLVVSAKGLKPGYLNVTLPSTKQRGK